MKAIFTALIIAAVAALAVTVSMSVTAPSAFAGGDDTIFPLDYPLPFPWNSIEGIWEVESTGFKAYYSFEVQHDCDSRLILKVVQIDPATRIVAADGIGYQNSDSKQIYAAMQMANGSSYVLNVGAYRDTHKFPHPFFGELSATEWLVLLGGHEARHTAQIERILSGIRAA